MSDFVTKKCDGCGKLRASDSNRWFIARWNAFCIAVYKWDDKMADVKSDSELETGHFCGEACLNSFLGEWMAQK